MTFILKSLAILGLMNNIEVRALALYMLKPWFHLRTVSSPPNNARSDSWTQE